MKIWILFLSVVCTFNQININEVRTMYKNTDGSKEHTLVLYDALQTVNKSDGNVLLAYKGASIAMKGRYEKGAKDKSEMFKNGISLVESALAIEPKNIEIRFIRLTIQQNSPKLLKYKEHIEEDKEFLLSNYETIKSAALKIYIKDYILHSDNFTEEEKNVTSHP